MLITWIAIGAVVLIIAGAAAKIVCDKKKGVKCIGCPMAQGCAHQSRMPCGSCTFNPDDNE